MRDTQVVFKNIDSGDSVRLYANQVIRTILDKAPHDSSGLALVEKRDDGYDCSLDIYSKFGPFIGHTFAKEPGRALDQLRSDIEAKIPKHF